MNILDVLKNANGQPEVNRTVGAIGGFVYIITAPALVWAGVIKGVTLTEFCLAFPTGLGAVIGSIAGAVAVKDRSVATAKIIADTGSAPGLAAPGTPAAPLPVIVKNPSGQPVPVEEAK